MTAGQPVLSRPARRVTLRRALSLLISIGLVVGVFWWFLPQFTDLSSVWASITAMSDLQVLVLIVAAAWNLATYWLVVVSTTPGLTYRQAAVVTETTTAVSNTLPAGAAIGIATSYAMYWSWGFSRSRASVSLLVSGVWNNFAKLALPVLALTLLALHGDPTGARLVAGIIGVAGLIAAVVLLGAVLHSEEAARQIGLYAGRVASALLRIFRRPPVSGWELATTKFRQRTVLLLRARWLWISAVTLISHLSLFLVLLLALRFVGVTEEQVSWIQALAVFAFARLLTAVPFTPGGLGVVELALITGLAAAGGPRAEVAAAVLVFRALTYVLPIPVGAGTYVLWRRNRSWRRAPGTAPRTALVPETT